MMSYKRHTIFYNFCHTLSMNECGGFFTNDIFSGIYVKKKKIIAMTNKEIRKDLPSRFVIGGSSPMRFTTDKKKGWGVPVWCSPPIKVPHRLMPSVKASHTIKPKVQYLEKFDKEL